MNSSSASGECDKQHIRLARRPELSASPDPTPIASPAAADLLVRGSKVSSRPESTVLVVVARIISPVAPAADTALTLLSPLPQPTIGDQQQRRDDQAGAAPHAARRIVPASPRSYPGIVAARAQKSALASAASSPVQPRHGWS